MNKTKLLITLIVVLVGINLFTLYYILDSRQPNEGRIKKENPRERIIRSLDFNSEQIAAYDLTIEDHKSGIQKLEKKLRRLRQQLYKTLENDANEAILIEEMTLVKTEIERTHYKHFKKIKEICRKDQMPKFYELTHKLGRIFGPPPPRRNHPNEGPRHKKRPIRK